MADETPTARPGPARRLLFGVLVAALTLASIELGARGLEALQRRFGPAETGETAFAVLANPVPAFERVGGEYRRTRDHWLPPDAHFVADKPPHGLRIFSLGGSAALGWPHGRAGGYAHMLERKLEALYPARAVEVVNAAGNTYASYRVRVVFDEVIEYAPDLVLLWSGNNEFLENVIYGMIRPPWPWSHSAVARILHVASGRARAAKPVVDIGNYLEADLSVSRISFAFGRPTQLREDPAQLERVAEHYRDNLDAMVRECRRRGVGVALIDVPVNLKDWWPNVSTHRTDLADEARDAFRRNLRKGLLALEGGDPNVALSALSEALRIDDGYAEAHFLRGRALQRLGDLAGAEDAYRRALAEDARPFRDIPRFAQIRRQIAADYGVPLIDAPGALAALAEDGIPGLDVFLDYVHPTVRANEAIAQEAVRALVGADLLPGDRAVPLDALRLHISGDSRDDLRVLLNLYPQYIIMRQYEHLDEIAARVRRAARPRPGDTAQVRKSKRGLLRLVRDAQRVLTAYRALLRSEKLGTTRRDYTPERARRIHDSYVDLVRQLEARELSSEDFESLVPAFTLEDDAA